MKIIASFSTLMTMKHLKTIMLGSLLLLLPMMATAQIQHVQGPPVNNQSSQPQKPPKPNKQTTQTPPKQNPTVASDYETFTVNGVSFNMVRVEGGKFMMGSENSEAKDKEKPVHQVTLSTYSIGETEVTQALWLAVMGQRPKHQIGSWGIYGKGGNFPAYYVDWEDCQKFIEKLNEKTGKKFRLPTEAEWEYAARGGNKSRGYKYAGSNIDSDVAWYSCGKTQIVKTKKANELGLYDMSGNVYEWCQDWYGNYDGNSQTNPKGPSNGTKRVIRGGGWLDDGETCRITNRYGELSDYPNGTFGFRLAL